MKIIIFFILVKFLRVKIFSWNLFSLIDRQKHFGGPQNIFHLLHRFSERKKYDFGHTKKTHRIHSQKWPWFFQNECDFYFDLFRPKITFGRKIRKRSEWQCSEAKKASFANIFCQKWFLAEISQSKKSRFFGKIKVIFGYEFYEVFLCGQNHIFFR